VFTGSAFDIRLFHEAVLSIGPVSLQTLEEFTTSWIVSQLQRSDAVSNKNKWMLFNAAFALFCASLHV
jgi:hypothetical protein